MIKVRQLLKKRNFEILIMSSIVINSALLTVNWPNQSQQTIQLIERINFFFLAIFILEAIIKLIAVQDDNSGQS